MSRRSMCMVLVVLLTLWGVGLPRFVHVMTAHVPRDAAGPSLITALISLHSTVAERRPACCSSCAIARPAPAADPSDASEKAETEETDCSEDGRHCPVCELLATLMTHVPAMPVASPAWQPVVERAFDAPAGVALGTTFDPHTPRGPPMDV